MRSDDGFDATIGQQNLVISHFFGESNIVHTLQHLLNHTAQNVEDLCKLCVAASEDLITRFARAFFATCCYHYIDDTMQPDFADAGDSGQIALGTLFERVGIPFSEKKRQHPETVQEELGVVCEMTHFHTTGTASVIPREELCACIIVMLEKYASDDKLTPTE